MNYTKVDELLAKAGCKFEFLHAYDYENFSPYQFAELIVEECVSQCWSVSEMEHKGNVISECSKRIRKHFGVEE